MSYQICIFFLPTYSPLILPLFDVGLTHLVGLLLSLAWRTLAVDTLPVCGWIPQVCPKGCVSHVQSCIVEQYDVACVHLPKHMQVIVHIFSGYISHFTQRESVRISFLHPVDGAVIHFNNGCLFQLKFVQCKLSLSIPVVVNNSTRQICKKRQKQQIFY